MATTLLFTTLVATTLVGPAARAQDDSANRPPQGRPTNPLRPSIPGSAAAQPGPARPGQSTLPPGQARTRPSVSAAGRDTTIAGDSVSVRRDSAQADDSFRTTVKYSSRDSSAYSADGQIMELFGDAEVEYGQISLKADYIRLNYTTSEVYAKGRYDSTTKKWVGQPVFQDGADKYDSKEMRYNFKTKKGLIQSIITTQGEGNIRGKTVKKDEEDNLYIRGSIYTTCNLAVPHFHINAPKLKVIKNKQVVSGPFNLVINQVPLPVGLPFGFFPFPKKKDIGVSGVIIPQYGEEPNGRGFYLRDGGYYWAVSENLGLQFRGQIYSTGSWGLGTSGAYNKRYRYAGGFDLRFNRNRSGDRVDTTQVPRSDFAITWSHAPQNIGRRSTFSANVNVTSNSFNQFNRQSIPAAVSNVAGSSVQYSRQFGQYARAGANLRVNQQFGTTNLNTNVRQGGKTDISTDFNVGVNQIAPFALKGGTGKWYESFRVGLDVSGSMLVNNTVRRQIDTTGLGFPVVAPEGITIVDRGQFVRDSIARAREIQRGGFGANTVDPNLFTFNLQNLNLVWQNRQVNARYSIPITLPNIKLLRYINLTPGFTISGDIYGRRLDYVYLPDSNAVRIDTTRGFFPSYNFATSASLNTRVYGTVFFRKGGRIQAIRHTLAPNVSISYVPNFSNPAFGMFQVLPAEGALAGLPENRRTLSRFRGLGGSASSIPSASAFISFGIVNQLEMKVRARDDSSGQEFKKVPILDNFSITGTYNALAPEYRLSPLNISANTQIFKNISFNFSSTFDPYAYVQYTPEGGTTTTFVRVNRFSFTEGQGLARMTNLQAFISGRLAPKGADKPKTAAGASDATMRAINANPDLYVDFNIPWSLNVSYTFSVNRPTPNVSVVVQALTLTGDFSLTPKWKFTFNTGYDFTFRSPSLTTVGINRDLHCWDMSFNWTPFAGSRFRASNYSFELRARSSILQDLKLSRRRSFIDNGGFGGGF